MCFFVGEVLKNFFEKMRRKFLKRIKRIKIKRRVRHMFNQRGRGIGMAALGLALAPQILGQASKI